MTTYVGLGVLVYELHSIPSMVLYPLPPPGPWPPSEDLSILHCLLLVSSILVFYNLWCVPQDDVVPSFSWFSHWSSIKTFPIKNLLGGGILSSSILKICPAHRSLLDYEFLILISWDTFALDEYDTLMSSAENFAQNRYSSFLWHAVPIIDLYKVCSYTFKCLKRGKSKSSCLSHAFWFPKDLCFLERSHASPFVIVVRATFKSIWVRGNGGML